MRDRGLKGVNMRDDMNIAARKKLGKENWSWCESESITGGILLTGSETHQTNGKTKWKPRKECDKVLLTMEDLEAVASEYESNTGNCHRCMGEKQEVFGWNIETGTKKRTCTRCGGTGIAPQ